MKPSNFQFTNPYLKEISFTINSDFDVNIVKTDIEIENAFNVNIEREENSNEANVELELQVNNENENVPFKLQIKVASHFKWKNLDEETIVSMLKVNAPALLLGYMRPIVANITNASIFPAYNLPFMNFNE